MITLPRKTFQAGFSLLELIIVIAIIALLTSAGAPAISGLMNSGTANQNISQLSGILEQAREYAVSQNMYVWVAFHSGTTATGAKQVSVAVIASTDGTDPGASAWQQYQYGAVPSSTLVLVNRIVTLKEVSLQNANSLKPSQLPASPAVADPTNSLADDGSGAFFSITLPGESAPSNFSQAIEFTPSGQARNGSSPIDVVDLDVQPQRGNVDDARNVAVLRVNGLTGETVVYRQ
jgi:prepilin-type N-terminal cleavage/methylation domain-containing protein